MSFNGPCVCETCEKELPFAGPHVQQGGVATCSGPYLFTTAEIRLGPDGYSLVTIVPGIAGRITQARRVQGLNKKQLAELAGLTPSYVTHLELGTRSNPSHECIQKLAHALHITMDYLKDGK